MMANLDPGTVVKRCMCAACRNDVDVKLNKNGMAYYYCPHGLCSHHQRWGRSDSAEFQREFLAKRAANTNAAPRQKLHVVDETPQTETRAADSWRTAFEE